MKSLTEFLKDHLDTSTPEEVWVDKIYLTESIPDELCSQYGLLFEKRDTFKTIPGTRYEYRIDPPNGEPRKGNLRHVHIYNKGKEILAMNVDGTAHDGFHQVKIPKEVADFLKEKGFEIPKDNLIEMMLPDLGGKQLLLD